MTTHVRNYMIMSVIQNMITNVGIDMSRRVGHGPTGPSQP